VLPTLALVGAGPTFCEMVPVALGDSRSVAGVPTCSRITRDSITKTAAQGFAEWNTANSFFFD